MTKRPRTTPDREGGRAVWFVVVGLLALVGGAYVALVLVAGDKLPRGTTVAGVEVGGLSRAAAVSALEDGLADRVDDPVQVDVTGGPGGTSVSRVDAADAGLSVDYRASIAAADAEKSWAPSRLWDYWTGTSDLDPVVTVDDTAMQGFVDALAADSGSAPVDGAVAFKGNELEITDPRPGLAIDPEQARQALVDSWLGDEAVAKVALTQTQPDIDADDVREAVDTFANPALSAPVTLVFGKSPVQLKPADYLPLLGMKAEDGELVPTLKTKQLAALVADGIGTKGAPVDATVALVNGKPKVVPAKPGVSYEPSAVADAFLELVARPSGQRRLEVEATVAEPEFTTADARALKIRTKVSTFPTYFPYAEYRNTNIGRAGELIDGTVLKPGETFSLNDTVGERTAENGFVPGFIISNGIFAEDLGGGVSQMATTTFNAAFFAGLEDVEHKPHSFYIDRYPVGREATVAWGAVDLRFKNDTPYGILIDAKVTPSTPSSQGVVVVSLWSTKVWDITTTTGDRYKLTSPATRTLYTENCVPNSGYGGFDIDVKRYFHKVGSDTVTRTENFHTTYTPSDTVICKPPGSEPKNP